jgi:hypothetical protein
MAGYSGTPLVQKLGIKAGHRVGLLNAPEEFERTLGPLPEGAATTRPAAGKQPFDVIVLFLTKRAALEREFGSAAERLARAGGLWIAWPKKASGVPTDLTENILREVCLPSGLVDNKVCAIDETWSGLRLVVRLKDRK